MHPTTERKNHTGKSIGMFRVKKEIADQTMQIHRLICNKEHIFYLFVLWHKIMQYYLPLGILFAGVKISK